MSYLLQVACTPPDPLDMMNYGAMLNYTDGDCDHIEPLMEDTSEGQYNECIASLENDTELPDGNIGAEDDVEDARTHCSEGLENRESCGQEESEQLHSNDEGNLGQFDDLLHSDDSQEEIFPNEAAEATAYFEEFDDNVYADCCENEVVTNEVNDNASGQVVDETESLEQNSVHRSNDENVH